MGTLLNQFGLVSRRVRLQAMQSLRALSDRVYLATHNGHVHRHVPDFAIIGAMKTGTTTLHNYLDGHPDIYMSYIKEPGLFLDDTPAFDRYPHLNSMDELTRVAFRGYSGQKLVGESSTYYTEAPTLGNEAPANMKKHAPDIKLIYMVRNPLDRIVSHYWHCIDLKIYSEPIDEVLRKDSTFLERSLYWFQLSRYVEHFARDHVHVVLFEAFKKDAARELRGIYEFLGVDPASAEIPTGDKVYNKSLSRTHAGKNASKFGRASYEELIGPIRDDVAGLAAFTGLDLPSVWNLTPNVWVAEDRA
jgi:hypothetical protein